MIRIVEDDYMDFLYDYFSKRKFIKERLIYPFKNPGFNMSICQFYNNQYLIAIRNVIPLTCLYDHHELEPGLYRTKDYNKLNNEIKNVFKETDYTQYTLKDWNNVNESTIFFVCKLDINTLQLKVNRDIEPFYIFKPVYIYPIDKPFKDKLLLYQHIFKKEDYRLFFEHGRCYSYDSHINQIHQISLYKDKLNFVTKFNDICNYRFSNNNIINNNDYKKIYEKNWTLLNVQVEGKAEKKFSFVHDFEVDGLYGVNYFPETQKCKKVLLIPYKKDSIPISSNCDFTRFSVGTTSCRLSNNEYLLVGHTKIDFMKKLNNLNNTFKKRYNNYYAGLGMKIHKSFQNKFGASYKPHTNVLYSIFFLYIDLNKKILKMSDLLFLIPDYKYKFSLTFPMSIINVKNNFIISGGYGDHTTFLLKLSRKDLMDTLIHKVNDDNFKIENINIRFVK